MDIDSAAWITIQRTLAQEPLVRKRRALRQLRHTVFSSSTY